MSIEINKSELDEILSGLFRLRKVNYTLDAEAKRIEFKDNHPILYLEEYNTGSELKVFINRDEEGGRIYFDIESSHGSIYDFAGEWTSDEELYVRYGNKELYKYTEDVGPEEGEMIYSKEELIEWFKVAADGGDPCISMEYKPDEFEKWLNDTICFGYIKAYKLDI